MSLIASVVPDSLFIMSRGLGLVMTCRSVMAALLAVPGVTMSLLTWAISIRRSRSPPAISSLVGVVVIYRPGFQPVSVRFIDESSTLLEQVAIYNPSIFL